MLFKVGKHDVYISNDRLKKERKICASNHFRILYFRC